MTTKLLAKMFSSQVSLFNNLSQWRHESSRRIMERGPKGEFQITNTGDEPVCAFAPPCRRIRPFRWTARSTEPLPRAMLVPEAPDGIPVLLSDLNRLLSACPTLVNLLIPFLMDIHKSTRFPFSVAPESIEILVEYNRTREFASKGRVGCLINIG